MDQKTVEKLEGKIEDVRHSIHTNTPVVMRLVLLKPQAAPTPVK
jgi:hypothetical protein